MGFNVAFKGVNQQSSTVELHLSGSTGTSSHPDTKMNEIIYRKKNYQQIDLLVVFHLICK